ncbi:hypothetical protein [Pseudomonas sp. F(2018)]|uniref:hypothetical protein n=1 Tax=Pseudomonas sp. F(2018) TaxID=2502240 RepID=UPI0010F72111|nr:hypothetical protein [Pseudomonas sp. F(2018)]
MNKKPIWMLVALVLSLTGCATAYVPSNDPSWLAQSQATSEQIWGPFHDLAGTTWTAQNQYQVTYRWIRPNAVLGEEFRNPATGALAATNTITPGQIPGYLQYNSNIFAWDGKIDGTSSILFTQSNAFSNMPFRMIRAADGTLLRENVSLRGGAVASVDTTTTYHPSGTIMPAPASAPTQVASVAPSKAAPIQAPVAAAALGPEWGLFAKLAGSNWVVSESNNLDFEWIPEKKLIHARMGDEVWDATYVIFSLRPGHQNEIVANSTFTGERDFYFGEPVGLVVLEGTNKAKHYFGENRFTYELVGSDKLLVHSEKWVNGELRKFDKTYLRESSAQKVERLARIDQYNEARAASERSTRLLELSASMNQALTAANAVAAANAAQSQANLDATLAAMSEQVERERVEAASLAMQQQQAAQAQQSSAVDGRGGDNYEANALTDSSELEAQQDATVAAALAQTQQALAEGGGDPAVMAQLNAVQQQIQQRQQQAEKRKQVAGTNKILPSKIQLSTATNSITPTPSLPEPAAEASNMAQGKVRLCNRPGDEGPAHWPLCPQTREEEAEARRLSANGGSGGAADTEHAGTSGSKKPVTGGSGDGSQGKPGEASTSDDEAFAWCTQNKRGFKCYGPYGQMATTNTLRQALGDAGCGKGEGETPSIGESTRFDCNVKKVKGLHGYVPDTPPHWSPF